MKNREIPGEVVGLGVSAGIVRTQASRRAGMVSRTKAGDPSGQDDISSAIAEAWVYWRYGVRRGWTLRILNSTKEERDVGPCEVASCPLGSNLLLRECDVYAGVPKATPYILVQLGQREDETWVGSICGFYPLSRRKRGRMMHRNGRQEPVWIIDADQLIPMRRLDAWITKHNLGMR